MVVLGLLVLGAVQLAQCVDLFMGSELYPLGNNVAYLSCFATATGEVTNLLDALVMNQLFTGSSTWPPQGPNKLICCEGDGRTPCPCMCPLYNGQWETSPLIRVNESSLFLLLGSIGPPPFPISFYSGQLTYTKVGSTWQRSELQEYRLPYPLSSFNSFISLNGQLHAFNITMDDAKTWVEMELHLWMPQEHRKQLVWSVKYTVPAESRPKIVWKNDPSLQNALVVNGTVVVCLDGLSNVTYVLSLRGVDGQVQSDPVELHFALTDILLVPYHTAGLLVYTTRSQPYAAPSSQSVFSLDVATGQSQVLVRQISTWADGQGQILPPYIDKDVLYWIVSQADWVPEPQSFILSTFNLLTGNQLSNTTYTPQVTVPGSYCRGFAVPLETSWPQHIQQ